MSPSAPPDLANVLLERYECIRTLDNQPQTKPELVESLNIPRSTLDDIVRDLEDVDLVEYFDGKWQLTLLGQYTLDHHTRYMEGLESLTDATPVIKELPRDTPVKRRFLIDAEVHVATTPVPDEVMQIFLEAVESATHVRGVTPLAMAGYAEPFYRCATTGSDAQLQQRLQVFVAAPPLVSRLTLYEGRKTGSSEQKLANATIEAILPLETFERLRTLHPDSTDRVMGDDDITLYHADIPVTFSLWIADDDHAGIIVYADQGVQGILINDTDDALDWATNQYDRIQKDAEPIFYRGSARRNAGFS